MPNTNSNQKTETTTSNAQNPLNFKGGDNKSTDAKVETKGIGKPAPRNDDNEENLTEAAQEGRSALGGVDEKGHPLTKDGKVDMRFKNNREDPELVKEHVEELKEKEEKPDMRLSENRNNPDLIAEQNKDK